MARETELFRLRIHKASQQAYVLVEGRRLYLGRAGKPETKENYRRTVAELHANGGRLPAPAAEGISVAELLLRFLDHAEAYYRKPDGTPTGEVTTLKVALRPVRELYGFTKAADFGPTAFRTVRDALVRGDVEGQKVGASRTYANACMRRVRHLFKWAVGQGLVAPAVLHALQCVEPLKRGRCDARETEPVRPAPERDVEAACEKLPRILAAMVRLQLATGMRPGELCAMRPADIDRSDKRVWIYRPREHKTAHHGRTREVYLGPKARRILAPFLLGRSDEAHLFSPAETVEEVRRERNAKRKTPPSCGNRRGTNRKRKPKTKPKTHYTRTSYARAVRRACESAKVAKWTPNQLRHTFASRVRAEHGIDAAATLLGHALGSKVTEVYAEADAARARSIVASSG